MLKPFGNGSGAQIWGEVAGCSGARGSGRVPTVDNAIDAALLEGHDVLGEGARLVGEDVLHLAQLLVEGGGAGLRRCPLLCAEHLLVPVDEVAVAQADDLHAAQGTGDEAWGGQGRRCPPPLGPWLQALRLGRNENGADTWARTPGRGRARRA